MDIRKADNSDYAVQVRREWVAKEYLSGVPSQYIWLEYSKKFDLTRHSFEKDITAVRNNISIDVKESFDEIVNNELLFLYDIRVKAMKEGDRNLALRVQKQVTDLIKLVAPKNNNGVSIQVNNQTNNMNLPDLSVDQIRSLLNGSEEVKTIDIQNE